MESEFSDTFEIGDWVICTAPGPCFGKAGEILGPANEIAIERGIDWWVLFTAQEGAGFSECDLMPDPRYVRPHDNEPNG